MQQEEADHLRQMPRRSALNMYLVMHAAGKGTSPKAHAKMNMCLGEFAQQEKATYLRHMPKRFADPAWLYRAPLSVPVQEAEPAPHS